MTPVEIAAAIVSLLLLISRFIMAAKPAWDRLPKPVAVLLPPIVAVIPPVIDVVNQVKSWSDLTTYIIASVAMIVTGLFPRSAPEAAAAKAAKAQP